MARKPKHAGEAMSDWITIVERSQSSVEEIHTTSSDLQVKYGKIHDVIRCPICEKPHQLLRGRSGEKLQSETGRLMLA